ncbi:MAG: hypothetical protein WC872_03100 [Candidatus Absconditabacterales bacterium]
MKDLVKRIVISAVSGALIGYLIFLFFGNNIIVQTYFLDYNNWYYLILILVCLVLFVFFGVYPVHFRMTKATLFVIGIALIIVGDNILLNDVTKFVYVADLFKIIGVVLTLLARTNVLITDKVKLKGINKKVEIIEV